MRATVSPRLCASSSRRYLFGGQALLFLSGRRSHCRHSLPGRLAAVFVVAQSSIAKLPTLPLTRKIADSARSRAISFPFPRRCSDSDSAGELFLCISFASFVVCRPSFCHRFVGYLVSLARFLFSRLGGARSSRGPATSRLWRSTRGRPPALPVPEDSSESEEAVRLRVPVPSSTDLLTTEPLRIPLCSTAFLLLQS